MLTTATMLNLGTAFFAVLAAGFWFASAMVKIPKEITMGWGGAGGTAQKLGDAVRHAGKRSGMAAASAGVAAICQGVSLLITECF